MSLMNDTLVRGYPFASASGQKTGANLEDLTTRAYPSASSQLVDQSSIETYSDATIIDDNGDSINRLRVKAGGITGEMLSSTAIFGPEILVPLFGSAAAAAAAAILIPTWNVAPTNIANIFDRSVATNWGNAQLISTAPAVAGYYWNLGAIYQGHILAIGNLASTSSVSGQLLYGFSAHPPTSGLVYAGSTSATPAEFTGLIPFYGQYVGIKWSSMGTSTIALQRFEVYGRTV